MWPIYPTNQTSRAAAAGSEKLYFQIPFASTGLCFTNVPCSSFLERSLNCEKRLLSWYLSVRLSARNTPASTTRIFMKSGIWRQPISKICTENSKFIKIGQKWRLLYTTKNIHLKYINNQQTHFNICHVFYSQCSHQHVSAGIAAIFWAKLLH